MSIKRFKLAPFRDNVYVIFTPEDLKTIKDIYAADKDYSATVNRLDAFGDNYNYATLNAIGHAAAHVVYLPICTRQSIGVLWGPMNNAITRYAAEIVMASCRAAGYNPVEEHTMFVQQVSRVAQRINELVSSRLGGDLRISSRNAAYLDMHLTPQQWRDVGALDARTLADLARQQCMIEDSGIVSLNDYGVWQATTFFTT